MLFSLQLDDSEVELVFRLLWAELDLRRKAARERYAELSTGSPEWHRYMELDALNLRLQRECADQVNMEKPWSLPRIFDGIRVLANARARHEQNQGATLAQLKAILRTPPKEDA